VALRESHERLEAAKAAFAAEDVKACAWLDANPEPKDRRAKKRHCARWRKDRDQSGIHETWEAQLEAEKDFHAAQMAVARDSGARDWPGISRDDDLHQ
jgi:hypothetical protein